MTTGETVNIAMAETPKRPSAIAEQMSILQIVINQNYEKITILSKNLQELSTRISAAIISAPSKEGKDEFKNKEEQIPVVPLAAEIFKKVKDLVKQRDQIEDLTEFVADLISRIEL